MSDGFRTRAWPCKLAAHWSLNRPEATERDQVVQQGPQLLYIAMCAVHVCPTGRVPAPGPANWRPTGPSTGPEATERDQVVQRGPRLFVSMNVDRARPLCPVAIARVPVVMSAWWPMPTVAYLVS